MYASYTNCFHGYHFILRASWDSIKDKHVREFQSRFFKFSWDDNSHIMYDTWVKKVCHINSTFNMYSVCILCICSLSLLWKKLKLHGKVCVWIFIRLSSICGIFARLSFILFAIILAFFVSLKESFLFLICLWKINGCKRDETLS